MEAFMKSLASVGDVLNSWIWSKPSSAPLLIIILLGTGIYFTIRTRCVQVRRVKLMLKLMFAGGNSEKGVSSFQAFALSVAGRVGTGNIAGVATAISLGGPGSLFWMWVIAILGASTSYVECTLAQIYKEEIDGEFRGGPSYYFSKVSGKKIFGILFSVITLLAMGVFLPGTQSNSISVAMQTGFFPNAANPQNIQMIFGIIVAVLVAFVVFGGTKRLGRVAEIVVPFMSIAYMVIAIIIIVLNFNLIPHVFSVIFKEAFTPAAGLGAVIGTAVLNGVKRGVYSNEAGQGTGPHAAAAAAVNHPTEQGLVQSFAVYFDTLLVCSATGFMIIITDSYNSLNKAGEVIHSGVNMAGVNAGPAFTQVAVSHLLGGNIGPKFVALALFFFAFTTLMAYCYMAECNIVFLTGKKDANGVETSSGLLRVIVRVVFLIFVVLFSFQTVDFVWNFADVGVGIMAWYNIIGIILIAKPALVCLKDYEDQLAQGIENPVFDPKKLGITNTEVW